MRLGTILGGKAWSDLKGHANKVERALKRQQKADAAKLKRRAELDAAGFRPLNGIDNSARKNRLKSAVFYQKPTFEKGDEVRINGTRYIVKAIQPGKTPLSTDVLLEEIL